MSSITRNSPPGRARAATRAAKRPVALAGIEERLTDASSGKKQSGGIEPAARPVTRVCGGRFCAPDRTRLSNAPLLGRSDKAKLRRSTSSFARKIPDAKPQKAEPPRLIYSADGSRAFSMDQTIAPASSVTVSPSAKVSTFASPTADGSLMQIRGLRSSTTGPGRMVVLDFPQRRIRAIREHE